MKAGRATTTGAAGAAGAAGAGGVVGSGDVSVAVIVADVFVWGGMRRLLMAMAAVLSQGAIAGVGMASTLNPVATSMAVGGSPAKGAPPGPAVDSVRFTGGMVHVDTGAVVLIAMLRGRLVSAVGPTPRHLPLVRR